MILKNLKYFYLLSLIICLSLSCKSKSAYENGDVVVIGKDTFDVSVDTHRIVEVRRIHPRNILEESSPSYLIKTNLDSCYISQDHRKIGDFQIYQILTKRK